MYIFVTHTYIFVTAAWTIVSATKAITAIIITQIQNVFLSLRRAAHKMVVHADP